MVAARLVFSACGNGGCRSGQFPRPGTATRIARIASASSTVAIKRKRPPQRGHASTSMSNGRYSPSEVNVNGSLLLVAATVAV